MSSGLGFLLNMTEGVVRNFFCSPMPGQLCTVFLKNLNKNAESAAVFGDINLNRTCLIKRPSFIACIDLLLTLALFKTSVNVRTALIVWKIDLALVLKI